MSHRHNQGLIKLLKKELEKTAFVPVNNIQPQDPTMAGAMQQQAAAEQAAMAQQGGMGGVDPSGGQMPVDPATGLPIDPNSGMPVDPSTGLPIDPNSGMPVDPSTGQPIDPAMLEQMMAGMGGGEQMPPEQALAPDGLPEQGEGGGEEMIPASEVEEKIKKVLTESGAIKQKKLNPQEQFQFIVSALEKLFAHMGLEMPELPDPNAPKEGERDQQGQQTQSQQPKMASERKTLNGTKAKEIIEKLKGLK